MGLSAVFRKPRESGVSSYLQGFSRSRICDGHDIHAVCARFLRSSVRSSEDARFVVRTDDAERSRCARSSSPRRARSRAVRRRLDPLDAVAGAAVGELDARLERRVVPAHPGAVVRGRTIAIVVALREGEGGSPDASARSHSGIFLPSNPGLRLGRALASRRGSPRPPPTATARFCTRAGSSARAATLLGPGPA
jgi:hypothetical protein